MVQLKPDPDPPNWQQQQEKLPFNSKKPSVGPNSHGGDPPADDWLVRGRGKGAIWQWEGEKEERNAHIHVKQSLTQA